MARVAVIVLNWNGIEDTLSCLAALQKQKHIQPTIVVVDNNSHDSDVSVLKKYQSDHDIKVIYNNKNLGFSGGVNTGIGYAIDNNFEYVALLNNDAVPAEDWLEKLMQASEKHKSGITTGLLLHVSGTTIDSTGDWYSIWGLPFPRNRGDKTEKAEKSGYVFGASGGASLYSVDMLKDIGLFDEDFFAYYEDVDVSFRAQLAGYKVYYTKKAIAYHKQGATSNKLPGFATKQTFKNLPLLLIKNVPFSLLPIIGFRFYIAYTLMFIKTIPKGSFIPALQGLVQSIYLTPRVLVRRNAIQRAKKVDNIYIKSILWNSLPPKQHGLRKIASFFKKEYR